MLRIFNSIIRSPPKNHRSGLFVPFLQARMGSYEKYGQMVPSYQEDYSHFRNPAHLNYHVHNLSKLLQHAKSIKDYKQLRTAINSCLMSFHFITNARVYQTIQSFQAQNIYEQISKLIVRTFSKDLNSSYQNMAQQKTAEYQIIAFLQYFQLVQAWNLQSSEQVITKFANSYMFLLRQTNIVAFARIYESLKQKIKAKNKHVNELESYIVSNCETHLKKIVQMIVKKTSVFNQFEMAVYLCWVRANIYISNDRDQKEKVLNNLISYLSHVQIKKQSNLQMQNIIYSLFLSFRLSEELKQSQKTQWLYQWHKSHFFNKKRQIDSLAVLNSHQDKLSCLKIQIILYLASVNQQKRYDKNKDYDKIEEQQYIISNINSIKNQIYSLNSHFWRYKYFCWLLDALLNPHLDINIETIADIFSSIKSRVLTQQDNIITLTIFLKDLTQIYTINNSSIVQIHVMTANWLSNQSSKSILYQNHSDLMQILINALEHPLLISIYTPCLAKIVQLSLGVFQWSNLTKLYYLGIRFNIQEYSQSCKQNMQYVRRYILNQYASMGMKRREIPEDSYFYQIHGITSPEKFYKNHLQKFYN